MTTINFSVIKNDTSDFAWTMTFKYLESGLAIDLTDAEIKADFKTSIDATTVVLSMSIVNSKIEYVDAANGIIKFAKQVIAIAAGIYVYDLQITFPSGDIKTYVNGQMTVIQDITDA